MVCEFPLGLPGSPYRWHHSSEITSSKIDSRRSRSFLSCLTTAPLTIKLSEWIKRQIHILRQGWAYIWMESLLLLMWGRFHLLLWGNGKDGMRGNKDAWGFYVIALFIKRRFIFMSRAWKCCFLNYNSQNPMLVGILGAVAEARNISELYLWIW